MIVFDLKCSNGHLFEGWFEDPDAFREQSRKGLVACPVCNQTQVIRVPSTFAIRSSQPVQRMAAPPPAAVESFKLAALTQKVAEFIDKNFDDVGTEFSREALKIHYGAAEPRSIRGVSTLEEEKTLRAEGVEFFKFPIPAPDEPEN